MFILISSDINPSSIFAYFFYETSAKDRAVGEGGG